MKSVFATAIAMLFLASQAWAAPSTVTLSVPGMDCAVCPITIKKALLKVPGVSQADVKFKERLAVVSFDDAKTRVDALMRATKDAGYPSTIKTPGL